MTLNSIRKQYEENYHQMLDIIAKMGGDDKIKEHRRLKSQLYNRLKALQRKEHYLDQMENRMLESQSTIHV